MDDAVTERGERGWSLHGRRSADHVDSRGEGGVLWSVATAREITALIEEDVAAGRIDRPHGDDLIGRVWDRAGPR